jgi:hypothetical protein
MQILDSREHRNIETNVENLGKRAESRAYVCYERQIAERIMWSADREQCADDRVATNVRRRYEQSRGQTGDHIYQSANDRAQ